MSKNSGIIARLPDERLVLVYRNQPLLETKGKIILHLIDEDYKCILNDDNKPKTILKNVEVYNEEMQAAKLIGYVD